MSNPYDPNAGQNPAGGGGFGTGGNYPANPYGDGGELPKKTDAVSIVGFVLSLTCCLSIVGAILGFVGLGRTKGGQRKGRWAAITAIIVGILGTLAAAGIIVAVVFVAGNVVTVDNAEVGQCVDIDDSDSSNSDSFLTKKECGEDHDGEVIAKGQAGDLENVDLSGTFIPLDVCSQLSDEGDFDKVLAAQEEQELDLTVYLEDPDDVNDADSVVCVATRSDGEKLSEGIL